MHSRTLIHQAREKRQRDGNGLVRVLVVCGTIINDIGAHEHTLPTLMAVVGETTIKGDLMKGKTVGNMACKVRRDAAVPQVRAARVVKP